MEYQFENLPNFRHAGGKSLTTSDGRTVKAGLIFRSSTTDFVTQKDIGIFQQLGIKSIIDLRGKREYLLSDGGDKRLKNHYIPFTVKNGKIDKLHPSPLQHHPSVQQPLGHRYLISMASKKLMWHLFNKLNIFIRWFTLLIALYDWIMTTNYFVKLFNRMALNDQSMVERYIDVLEYNKIAIRDCFKIICEPDNMPTLIHCAHGKDRTGLLIALILACIGVNDYDIAKDYGLSKSGLSCIKQRVYDEIVLKYGFDEKFTSCDPITMTAVIGELNKRYGSVINYILSVGITTEHIEILQNILLE